MNSMDFFSTPGTRWIDQHGNNPALWPLPDGQALPWAAWARAFSNEAVRLGLDPAFWPWDDEDIRYYAETCWLDHWVTGKSPESVALGLRCEQDKAAAEKAAFEAEKAIFQEALRVIAESRTKKIRKLREHNLIVVNNLFCSRCRERIFVDPRSITEQNPDGTKWQCFQCGDVDTNGNPCAHPDKTHQSGPFGPRR